MRSDLKMSCIFTLKNPSVDPEDTQPYRIRVCFTRSSALSIGESILSIVRNAARLAVYDEIMIKVKNHQTVATVLDDMALKNILND